jgi:hypothetical protein
MCAGVPDNGGLSRCWACVCLWILGISRMSDDWPTCIFDVPAIRHILSSSCGGCQQTRNHKYRLRVLGLASFCPVVLSRYEDKGSASDETRFQTDAKNCCYSLSLLRQPQKKESPLPREKKNVIESPPSSLKPRRSPRSSDHKEFC